MAKKMLIDSTHAEETRVVVMDGQRLDEFDFESINKKQLAGNIYLAKVMRVEPSLQAAFVDYGGNRHGFLAFSEIHPDYYQIPAAERAALVAAQERSAARSSESDDDEPDAKPRRGGRGSSQSSSSRGGNARSASGSAARPARRGSKPARQSRPRKRTKEGTYIEREFRISGGVRVRLINPNDVVDLDLLEREFTIGGNTPVRVFKLTAEETGATTAQQDGDAGTVEAGPENDAKPTTMHAATDHLDRVTSDDDQRDEPETLGGGDDWDDQPVPRVRMRDYKIQDVIKRRQIMLIQINKEERGNKGAAVTTYLSLAGRYCVLMPNTNKGGGISRKITNAPDRKRLKEIAGEMEVPKGMGLIIRTAGAQRTSAEVIRDYEYLLRQWEAVRNLTMESFAPAAIYEEGSLIKRSIRDLYTKEIDEIWVEGEAGYREAHDYMQMLMPSHTKYVRQYKEQTPLFINHQVENHLAAMFNPTVQLKSGGYIVIGITEALVAVDVNSGRSTRESSIEDTAVKTNLEAAEELARQVRLRDLAGLIVIDFIDMNERRNNAAVERKLKDKLASDRARIQVGRISSFGLLEMSRQRLRPGMLEATTTPCVHCHGTGIVRSDDTMALTVLREIEEEALRNIYSVIKVEAPVSVANFLHNHKRDRIVSIEQRYGIRVVIEGDTARISPDFELVKMKLEDAPEQLRPAPAAVSMESVYADEGEQDDAPDSDPVETAEAPAVQEARPAEDDGARKRGKRGSKRKFRDEEADPLRVIDTAESDAAPDKPFDYADDESNRSNSRRSRRGGRGRRRTNEAPQREFGEAAAFAMLTGRDALDRALPEVFRDNDDKIEITPAPARKKPQKAKPEPELIEAAPVEVPAENIPATDPEPVQEAASPEVEEVIETGSFAPEGFEEPHAEETPQMPVKADEPPRPKRSGWWSR